MTNSDGLRALIKLKGLKLGFIANKLGISTVCLQQKINNITEFKSSEVQEMCNILGISNNLELKDNLFFALVVD